MTPHPRDAEPADPNTPRLYDDLAWLWPLISPPEDYATEAAVLLGHIREHFGIDDQAPLRRPGTAEPLRVLEFGAGGGHTLTHLAHAGMRCTAADLSESMLDNCRRLVPDVDAHLGDMRTLDLTDRQPGGFDVVLIHDAIDYLLTPDDLAATCANVRRHLAPDGLACIAPTYTLETLAPGEFEADRPPRVSDDRLRGLAYCAYISDPDPNDQRFDLTLVYLLEHAQRPGTSAGPRVEVVTDRHTCGVFDRPTWLTLLQDAGFDAIDATVTLDPQGPTEATLTEATLTEAKPDHAEADGQADAFAHTIPDGQAQGDGTPFHLFLATPSGQD